MIAFSRKRTGCFGEGQTKKRTISYRSVSDMGKRVRGSWKRTLLKTRETNNALSVSAWQARELGRREDADNLQRGSNSSFLGTRFDASAFDLSPGLDPLESVDVVDFQP